MEFIFTVIGVIVSAFWVILVTGNMYASGEKLDNLDTRLSKLEKTFDNYSSNDDNKAYSKKEGDK